MTNRGNYDKGILMRMADLRAQLDQFKNTCRAHNSYNNFLLGIAFFGKIDSPRSKIEKRCPIYFYNIFLIVHSSQK